MKDIKRRLRQAALPDPYDEREVVNAPLLQEAATRIAELERERERFFAQQMESADWVQMSREYQERAEKAERKLADCAPYLKDGESPAECIARNRADVDAALALLAERTRERNGARRLARALRAELDRLREVVDDAIQNQRCDAPGWFTWWTAWVLRATALRDGRER